MRIHSKVCFPSLLGLALLAPAPLAAQVPASGDKVILSFAITGDIRIDPTRPKLTSAGLPKGILEEFHYPTGDQAPFPFYFNIVQMRQNLADLAAIKDPVAPRYLFLTGDLVHGFARDQGVRLRDELKDFTQALKVPTGNLQVVPLPGNHEMTFKTFTPNAKGGFDMKTGDDLGDSTAWDAWIHDNHFDRFGSNGPGKDALDQFPTHLGKKVLDDQSHVTYSFDDGPVHFVVINTDTSSDIMTEDQVTKEELETEGLLPFRWVKEDLEKAQRNPRVQEIFVVGHKPVVPPANFKDAGPFDSLHEDVAEPFRQLLVRNTKVVAYLCSHAHLWHVDSLADHAAAGDVATRPLQVVAGNGGVEFEKFWKPQEEAGAQWLPGEKKGPFFGFTLFKVFASGKVTYNSWQRERPEPYYGAYGDPAKAKARPRAEDVTIKGPAKVLLLTTSR